MSDASTIFCNNCGGRITPGGAHCPKCGITRNRTADNLSSSAANAPTPHSGERPPSASTMGATAFTTPSGGGAASMTGQLAGRVLGGRYQLGECIGSGGMGEIYRARRLHIGDTVAVKVLRPEIVTNERSRARFHREARAAAMLHHPNAVVIHDFGEDADGLAYIVMELLIGRSLRQVLGEEGALDPLRAYGVIRQACAALEAGHKAGIIHRDIKPDNIFLLAADDDTDHVKILDFGIAKLRDKALETLSVESNLTNVGTIIGTPNYMSPEQCQGEEADARSDIYSLGVVLYESLTGVMPFVAKTPTGVAIKHVTEKPRPLTALRPGLDPGIERVVLHALEKSPEARLQSMLELARAFAAALKEANAAGLLAGGALGAGTLRIETPVTGSAPRVETVNRPREENDDTFKTAVTPLEAPTQRQQREAPTQRQPKADTARQRLTTPLQSGADNFQTAITPPETPAPPSFETVLTPPPTPPRDPYATMIPPPPDEAPRSPFAENKTASSRTPQPVERTEWLPAQTAAPARPTQTAPAPVVTKTGSAAKPLFIGLAALLLISAAAAAWLLLSRETAPQQQIVQVSPTPAPTVQTAASPAPSPTTPVAPAGMAFIPGGVFQLGRDDGEENARPAQTVTVAPFYLDLTEVTNEQYQKFVQDTGHATPWPGGAFPAGAEQLPVTGVSWEDADGYAQWAGKRLPTETEWEFAARGPENRLYPWGNEWQSGFAHLAEKKGRTRLAPVATHQRGQNPFGVHDLIGNAWEWTASDYAPYPGGKIAPPPDGYQNLKVIRGGSHESQPKQATATLRRGWPATRNDWPDPASANYAQTGFRCAQDPK